MKKIITGVALLLATFGFAKAQIVNYRVEAGVNFANVDLKLKGIKLDDPAMKTGYRVGAGVEFCLTSSLYFVPGITFKMNGTKINVPSVKAEIKEQLHYLSVPLNVGFRMPLTKNLGVSLEAGPYMSFLISQDLKADDALLNKIKKLRGKTDLAKRIDWGLGLSATVDYSRFYLRVGSEFGLYNTLKNGDSNNSAKNNNFYTAVGMRF
ncbi:porin family protein [Porphyromonas macacae]|uniref:porin family protein n=1 Tax=Porphyromonas macacae TaxID=28115 RepID=UPI000690EA7A|nr:porin family protein [Porphyromonas macacae]